MSDATNFFVRDKRGRHPIVWDNIVTRCPNCGKWHKLGISEFCGIMTEYDADLAGVSICCADCTKKKEARK